MPPPNKRRVDPDVNPQDLCRLLLRLKLKLNAAKNAEAAEVRECRGAAEAVESCVASLEQSQPLLQRALQCPSAQAAVAEVQCVEMMTVHASSSLVALPTLPSSLNLCCAGKP
jgi:hypothetical protein